MFTAFTQNKTISRILTILLLVGVLTPVALVPLSVSAQEDDLTVAIAASTTAQINAATFGCFGGDGASVVTGCLAFFTYKVSQGVAYLAAQVSMMLNYVVIELVVRMGSMFGSGQPAGDAVLKAWGALRDIANVFLVFLTIWIGIATILGVSGYGYKQLLWKVVLAALFVNFSVTLSKFVIDVSNLAATQTYEMLLTTSESTAANTLNDGGGCLNQDPSEILDPNNPRYYECLNVGISGIFWNQFKPQTIWDQEVLNPENRDEIKLKEDIQQQLFYIGIFATILFAIMFFVFASAMLILLTRYITLVFLIIVSPIALVMWITGVSGMGRKWWHMLINQSLVAPAMFLMWWLSYILMTGMNLDRQWATRDKSLAEAGLGSFDSLTTLLFFAIVAGFLIASLVVARSLGAAGASAALKTGSRWSRKAGLAIGAGAGAATVGMAARGMRRGAGWAADKAGHSDHLAEMSRGNIAKRAYANLAYKATDKAATSSFDVRAVAGKTAQKYVGGPGGKGGYAEIKRKQMKQITEKAKRVGESSNTSEEKATRDKAVRSVNRTYDTVEKTNVESDITYRRSQLQNDLQGMLENRDSAETAGDTAAVAKIDRQMQARNEADAGQATQQTTMKEQIDLQMELKSGKSLATGKKLTQEEEVAKQQTLAGKNKNVRDGYRYHDDEVARLYKTEQEAKRRFAVAEESGNAADKKKYEAEVTRTRGEQKTIIDYHESKREHIMFGSAPAVSAGERNALKKNAETAENRLTQLRAQKGQEIDKELGAKGGARGAAQKEAYLNKVGAEPNIFGFVTEPNRQAAAAARKASKKDKFFDDFKKITAENKDEWGLADETPATPATPATPEPEDTSSNTA